MGWTTLYITGKGEFQHEVGKSLEKSGLRIMNGYATQTRLDNNHELYWIHDKTDLRAVKKAIGSKTIWQYRLRFYYSWEELAESGEISFYGASANYIEKN